MTEPTTTEPTTARSIGTYRHFGEEEPALRTATGAFVHLHRSLTMVCAYVSGGPGASYSIRELPDESFCWVLFDPVVITAGADRRRVEPGAVVIVPPGTFSLELAEGGSTWLGMTSSSGELCAQCPNDPEYADPPTNVAPLVAWPAPPDGYRLRVYRLEDGPAGRPRCYRHRSAMTRFIWPVPTGPRDPAALSPHAHGDFEQASLIHSGTEVHHMRRPWGADRRAWMDDEHVELRAPALVISKPPDIHTTEAVSSNGPVGLIDFFAPPRFDFSAVEGLVLNAAEYPMPPAPDGSAPA